MRLLQQREDDVEKVQLSAFRLERFMSSDIDYRFYTGFSSIQV